MCAGTLSSTASMFGESSGTGGVSGDGVYLRRASAAVTGSDDQIGWLRQAMSSERGGGAEALALTQAVRRRHGGDAGLDCGEKDAETRMGACYLRRGYRQMASTMSSCTGFPRASGRVYGVAGGVAELVAQREGTGWRRTMPFGLKNAGATYQRMMQKCLATQIGKNVQVYIDDVVITTKQGSSLIDDLKETFDNLDKFQLKLNPTKCSFGVPAGELLEYLVSARGIEASPEKIQAIVTMRKPTKLKEIQQLTGRVAALSRFVARLGEKALPFYALIKQGEKFEWNEEADKAFEHLKRTISTPPVLVAPKEK
ncbi:hypothetical protein QYE76_046879 [Lolium multiflorum]|uniref:Reverse transcriptase domain-containing protein n=1 Tax=Lolium multiflorum TaxID=4521 RepID=A0AAD8TP59_LOLMU|nr:hypothetical protein QYE76_046879 [Lolium multiflorum]